MIEGDCDCGAVRVAVETAPQKVTDCNCSICRRYGALWAYYHPREVRILGATTIYLRGDKILEFHHCAVCRCLTHWAPVDKAHPRMGVNARLLPPEVLAAAAIRKFDGAAR